LEIAAAAWREERFGEESCAWQIRREEKWRQNAATQKISLALFSPPPHNEIQTITMAHADPFLLAAGQH
jgi:hypothetical protein